MKLRCKKEAISELSTGDKLMEFTKGNVYEFEQADEYTWETEDDKGNIEVFFDTTVMFERI